MSGFYDFLLTSDHDEILYWKKDHTTFGHFSKSSEWKRDQWEQIILNKFSNNMMLEIHHVNGSSPKNVTLNIWDHTDIGKINNDNDPPIVKRQITGFEKAKYGKSEYVVATFYLFNLLGIQKDFVKQVAPEQISIYPKPNSEKRHSIYASSSTAQTFTIVGGGWSAWGGLKAKGDIISQKVTFAGNIGTGGYVIQRSEPFQDFSGKALKLRITGTESCSFHEYKLLKFEVNDSPLKPLEKEWINMGDKTYINAADGTVSFQLPPSINKMQFVFYNAKLKDLTISGEAK